MRSSSRPIRYAYSTIDCQSPKSPMRCVWRTWGSTAALGDNRPPNVRWARAPSPAVIAAPCGVMGWSALARSPSASTVLVLSLGASLLAYLKRLEEGELAERFGEAYLSYKRETPFIIPRLPRRR